MNIFVLILLILAFVLFVIAARWRPAAPPPWDLPSAGLACVALALIILYASGGSFHNLFGATR